MGLRFRKSINLGGFRINISKKGIGYSYGVKGARVTHTANGTKRTTLSVPGTGISYIHETGKNKKTTTTANKTSNIENNIKVNNNSVYNESQCLDINEHKPAEYKEFLDEISNVKKLNTLSVVLMWSAILYTMVIPIFTGIAGLILYIYIRKKMRVEVRYNFEDGEKEEYEKIISMWRILKKSQKILNNKNRIKNVKIIEESPWFLDTNIPIFGFKTWGTTVLFLPDKLLLVKGSNVGAASYSDISINCGTETISLINPPRDAEFAYNVWQHSNKDGTRDKRYSNNASTKYYRFGRLQIQSKNGLDLDILLSNKNCLAEFVEASSCFKVKYGSNEEKKEVI